MSNIPIKTENAVKEYNSIPVFYCKHCLSLRIMGVSGMDDAEYCDNCGSTNIEQTSIEEWETLYKQRFGIKFLESNY